jgi:hypothetical protein
LLGLRAGLGWRVGHEYVFTVGWGGPVHPDTVSSLVGDLIEAYNGQYEKAAQMADGADIFARSILAGDEAAVSKSASRKAGVLRDQRAL